MSKLFRTCPHRSLIFYHSTKLLVKWGAIASILSWAIPTQAQIIPDTTLPVNSTVAPSGNTLTINGGTTAGGNLFHSFKEFSVPTGGEAFFNNAANIQNIFTRVTGNSISNIDGLIRANGGANLFLLNPNGIIFGANARLNIGGSFISTTANQISFADGYQFNATNPQTTPLLTVSTPVGLGFGSNPGAIQVRGSGHQLTLARPTDPFTRSNNDNQGLQVQPGRTLALVGGGLTLDGGMLTAAGGRVELGSVAEGKVSINPTAQGFELGYDNVPNFQDISLSQRALVDASGNSSGSIQIQARSISLNDGSVVLLQNQGTQPGGNIRINATDSLVLNGTTSDGKIRTTVMNAALGAGAGGDVAVSTERLLVQNGALMEARTYSTARGGNFDLNATQSVQVDGFAAANPSLVSIIGARTFGLGNAGKAGNVTISTRQLSVLNGGLVIATSFGAGAGGRLNVNAGELVQVSGYSSALPTNVSTVAAAALSTGDAGNVIISTQRLLVSEGGIVAATTFGSGTAGSLTVNADSVEIGGTNSRFNPSALSASSNNSGNAGKLTVNTRILVVRDSGAIASSGRATGLGGDVTINASESVEVIGFRPGATNPSQINSAIVKPSEVLQQQFNLPPIPQSNGGDVTINTPSLRVADGARVSVRNEGVGNAGTLRINADRILLENQASLTATTASGDRGNINLRADSLEMRRNSSITTTARGSGDGGNLEINADVIAALENSDISANAVTGTGGKITINTLGIFGTQFRPQLTPESDITASSLFGLSGTVAITNPEVEPGSFVVDLTAKIVDPTEQITTACNPGGNSFTVTGRGGMPENPSQGLLGRAIWWDNRDVSAMGNSATISPENLPQQPTTAIVEATGWVRNAQGQVELVANGGRNHRYLVDVCGDR